MTDTEETDQPAGLTFGQIADLAFRLHHRFPTPLPPMSSLEVSALVGGLHALWIKETKDCDNIQ